MGLGQLGRLLLGERAAILAAGATPGAWRLGLLLVLSAGLAREYDGEYLVAAPWHLLLPLVASLATSLLLFTLLTAIDLIRGAPRRPWLASYVQFLTLYWLTAPLAWLYALPVERLLPEAEAVRANLIMLGLVAAWRVLLMARIVAVLRGCSYLRALFPVMLFADVVALQLLQLAPLPVISMMGGVRLTAAESLLRSTACTVVVWGVLTMPVWCVGTLLTLWRRWKWTANIPPQGSAVGNPPVWLAAVATCGLLLAVLPWTQSEQRLRYRVERLFAAGRVAEGLAVLNERPATAFPPHWDPPPRIAYRNPKPPVQEVLRQLATHPAPRPDLLRLYLDKWQRLASSMLLPGRAEEEFWTGLTDRQLQRLVAELASYPERSSVRRTCLQQLEAAVAAAPNGWPAARRGLLSPLLTN